MARQTHYGKHKQSLDHRLGRMEGQLRGIRQMVADDRYCLDVVQQLTALIAATRSITALVVEDHLMATLEGALEGHEVELARRELAEVLRRSLRT